MDEGVAIRVGDHFVDHADGKAAGEDLIAARGEHDFAFLDALVGQDVYDFQLSEGVAAQDAANARGFKNHAGAAGLVVDGEHLGGVGKHVADLADDSVRSDDGVVAGQAVGGTLVDVEDVGQLAAAGADGLGGHGFVNVLLLKFVERLQTFALLGVFEQGGLLKAEAVDGFLQVLILLADVAQIQVVLPQVPGAKAGGVDEPLRRRNQGVGPEADQSNAGRVGGVERASSFAGAAHLHGQANDLHEQDSQQHEKISVADEERFHRSRVRGSGVRVQ